MSTIDRFKKQTGDTLIEVMLAMVVVGLSLGLAYGITNRALATGRLAQERTEALKLAESQIELLKENARDATNAAAYRDVIPYCILPSAPKTVATDAACTSVNGTFYGMSVGYSAGAGGPDSYTSIVVWDVPQSKERARVQLVYRP